jgi:catalase
MMDGFGVHTYRLINEQGKSTFVKFHWKPLLGVHSLVWDEAQQLAGKNLDFNRRDLWEAIVNTVYPEYELALQLVPEAEAEKAPFDILDATKIWPEDQFPLQRVGKLTLNRNPDNFFSETEDSRLSSWPSGPRPASRSLSRNRIIYVSSSETRV